MVPVLNKIGTHCAVFGNHDFGELTNYGLLEKKRKTDRETDRKTEKQRKRRDRETDRKTEKEKRQRDEETER